MPILRYFECILLQKWNKNVHFPKWFSLEKSFPSSLAKLSCYCMFCWQLHVSVGYLDPCFVTDPWVVPWHSGVDAVLPVLGTLLTPADNACQEPNAFVIGGVRPSAVSLARILLFVWKARTEHKACDVVPAALLAEGPVHIRDPQLLELGGLGAQELQSSPAAHQGAAGLPQEVLNEVFGAQADGSPLVGQFHWGGELQ